MYSRERVALAIRTVRNSSSRRGSPTTSNRSDSLTSTELDNEVIDSMDQYFAPTIPQLSTADEPPISEMCKRAPEQPIYVKHLMIAYKAFKEHGWMAPARAFRRYAYELGSFENKEQFALARETFDLPELPMEEKQSLAGRDVYLDLAFARVKEAIAELKKNPKKHLETTEIIRAMEKSLRQLEEERAAGGFVVAGEWIPDSAA